MVRLSLFAIITLVVTMDAYFKDEIFVAVRNDDPEDIQKALDDGANINQIGTGEQTPLINAVLSRKINVGFKKTVLAVNNTAATASFPCSRRHPTKRNISMRTR
jgi:hypothetical protein